MGMTVRIGVLASGTGTLLQAILDGSDLYEVAVVISDRPGILALERAERAGVPAYVVDWTEYGAGRRAEFSEAVAKIQREHDIDLSVSAGFMRILTGEFFRALKVPAMNSHPALLPAFTGPRGVHDALAWGAKVTGTTIHFATEDVDSGPIIFQEAVPVLPGDTEETLHKRIKEVEQRLYPEAIRLFAQGRLRVDGRRVTVTDATG